MSANPGGGGLQSGYTSDQVEEAKAFLRSVTPAGSKQRLGRGRGSTPSPASSAGRGRGRGYTPASARPVPSPATSSNSYRSFTSMTVPRTTHAPGATKSGAINPHFAQYTIGASTAAPVFKSPPRQRAVSPVRAFSGPVAVPALKPKSPPKLRSSILVPDSTRPMVPAGGDTMVGGTQGQSQVDLQSGWVDVPEQSSAYVNPIPANGGWNTAASQASVDPRFTAVQSSHPLKQQPGRFFSGDYGEGSEAQGQNTPSTQAAASFCDIQGQGPISQAGRLAGQTIPDPGRVPITTNWTDDDPTKPIIPGHLRQPNGEKVVEEIAGNMGVPVSNVIKGTSTGSGQGAISIGISSSIYAPGNARGNSTGNRANHSRYQGDVNDSEWMTAAANRNHKSGSTRIPPGDGDVEMSDVQVNTKSSAPQGPVEWNNLPTLSASKYADPSTFSNNPPSVPNPAPSFNVGNENIKPTQQVPAQGFGDINKNIAADLAKSFSFNGAAGQPMSNPFLSTGGQATQNPTRVSGFGAAARNTAAINPFLANAVGSASVQYVAPATQTASSFNGFGAPSAPPPWGSVDHSGANGQNGFGASQSVVPARVNNTSHSNGFGAPSAPPVWGSVNHSASNGPNGFSTSGFGAPAQSAHHGQTAQTTINGFGTQATNGSGSDTQSISNGDVSHGGFSVLQPAPLNPFASNGSDGSSGNVQTGHGFGASQSAAMGQVKVNPFLSSGPGVTSQPAAAGQGAQNNPFMSNGGPSNQNPFTSHGFGVVTSNAQPAKPSNPIDVSNVTRNIENDMRGLFHGKAPAPSYEAPPFSLPVMRSAAASNASGDRQPGSGAPLYQVVPESKKATGLAASRWA